MTTRLIRIDENSKCGARTQKPIVGVTGYCLKIPMIPLVRYNVHRLYVAMSNGHSPIPKSAISSHFCSNRSKRIARCSSFIVHHHAISNQPPYSNNNQTAELQVRTVLSIIEPFLTAGGPCSAIESARTRCGPDQISIGVFE
jgi:hypothetical protein